MSAYHLSPSSDHL